MAKAVPHAPPASPNPAPISWVVSHRQFRRATCGSVLAIVVLLIVGATGLFQFFGSSEEEILSIPRGLNLQNDGGVIVVGHSNSADFAHQLHITFSADISGVCMFAGQPFHCATTRFTGEPLLDDPLGLVDGLGPTTCDQCPKGKRLIYDHCKSHPEWVDVGVLWNYIKNICSNQGMSEQHCIDPIENLRSSRVYLFRGTRDRCYLPGSMTLVQDLYAQIMDNVTAQVKVENTIPYGHVVPVKDKCVEVEGMEQGKQKLCLDGPGDCLRWLFPDQIKPPSQSHNKDHIHFYDQTELMDETGVGLNGRGDMYIPEQCRAKNRGNPNVEPCKLLLLPGGCDGKVWGGRVVEEFAAYAETNGIVVVRVCMGGDVDSTRFPRAHEVKRGMLDVYGDLGSNYTLKSGPHMKFLERVIHTLLGRKASL